MPRGKKRSRAKPENNAPISSLATAVATDETLSALAVAGLSAFEGTEAEALAVLAVKGGDNPSDYAPRCFQKQYDPERELCAGCVFSAECWQRDSGYLRRAKAGKAPLPLHIPATIAQEVIDAVKPLAAPPKPRKRK